LPGAPSRPARRSWRASGAFDGRPIDPALFHQRFGAARRLRLEVLPPETTGYRAVKSEGDHCPGVLLDVFGDVAEKPVF
jgi:23S rRNA G2069 N7-methylase RlmK/C1962 C5-methylase RlmI